MKLLLPLVLVVAIVSCATVPQEIPDTLSQPEYFQRAQEAVEVRDWNTALAYYNAVIDRFPEDLSTVVSAEYEIAFVAYKRGFESEAAEGFRDLLERYNDGGIADLPEWPKVLAEKLLREIEAPENESVVDDDLIRAVE